MALQIQGLKRIFKVKIGNKDLELSDPNMEMTPDEVMSFYDNTYPELTTATVHGPDIKDDKAVYTFKTTIGTKG